MTDDDNPLLRLGHYILDADRQPRRVYDLLKWARWFETADRIVAQTDVPGGVVSTVFLGFDHSWGSGPPVLWETMVFLDGNALDLTQRYSTSADASAGHADILARVLSGQLRHDGE